MIFLYFILSVIILLSASLTAEEVITLHSFFLPSPLGGQSAESHTHMHTHNSTTGGDHFSVLSRADDAHTVL